MDKHDFWGAPFLLWDSKYVVLQSALSDKDI